MSQIAIFNFSGRSVRVINDDSENPWFNANDVCSFLGYADIKDAIKTHVDPDDLMLLEAETKGGFQKQNHVNESGLYTLIFGSKKDEAKAFKRWVTSEVLPSIRKTGGYTLPDHELKRLALFERAKSDPSLRISKRDCEYSIAKITGDTATVQRIEREAEKEQHWRDNTAEGWVQTYFENVGSGFADTVKVPIHINVADVIQHAKKHFKTKGVTLEIEDYGDNKFWYETI